MPYLREPQRLVLGAGAAGAVGESEGRVSVQLHPGSP